MPSNIPMPITPMPVKDLPAGPKAYVEQGGHPALAGIFAKAGPLADLFLPYYKALMADAEGKSLNVLGIKLTELVRLAVATTTGCEACLGYRDSRAALDEDVITLFDEVDRADFTPRERAAIRYTLAFCTNHHQIDEAMWNELKAVFDDQELVTLCMFVATFLGTGRFAHVIRLIDSHCTIPGYRLAPLLDAKGAWAANSA
jgi:alkylhydroperoxidase family enzyme